MDFQIVVLLVCGIAGGIVITVAFKLLKREQSFRRVKKENDHVEESKM